MLKKILKNLAILLLVLIGIALVAPYIFKNKIAALIQKEIGDKINAKVDYSDVNISFFRRFPKVAVGLDDVQVLGTDVFATDTLLSAKRLDAGVDIMSLLRGSDLNIYSVTAQSPRIHAIVSKSGLANWDIIKQKDTAANAPVQQKAFTMQLQWYAINNGYISYMDERAGASGEAVNINHKGTGDFTAGLFTLKTTIVADAVTLAYNGITYLSNAKTIVNAFINVDNNRKEYSFSTADILVNDLKVNAKGTVKNSGNKGYDMDIQFGSPSTEFKNMLSLIPAIYQNDFDKIKTSGTVVFKGFVKGIYNETLMPAYHLDMQVMDGFFQYPDLPKSLREINIKAQIDNPNGQPDNGVINIERAHFEMDKEPFDFRLLAVKPSSNMFIDAEAKGKLDLSKISQCIKLQKGTRLTGLLNANVYVKGNVADIEKQQYGNFSAGGTVSVADFFYISNGFPAGIKINNLLTYFSPAKVDINNLSGRYRGSNFIGSGQVNNLLSYLLNKKPLNAVVTINADNVNLNDWMEVKTDTTSKALSNGAFTVDANLDVSLNATINKLHYDKLDIENFTGSLQVNDGAVTISDAKGNTLDGTILLNGLYSTKAAKESPTIVMQYDATGVDVQKAFLAFKTMQQLMPAAKFITGKLTAHLSLTGKLGSNMQPDMAGLSGNGNLLLTEGVLSKFAPLDKIAGILDVKVLEQISLNGVQNDFEFSNGKILVHPFTVNVGAIDMEIGGLHGFDQHLQYLINMQLPRSLMGAKGNQLVNKLTGQPNKKALPLSATVDLKLTLGGSFSNPTLQTELWQSNQTLADQLMQQAADFAKAKIDSTKPIAKDTVATIKKGR